MRNELTEKDISFLRLVELKQFVSNLPVENKLQKLGLVTYYSGETGWTLRLTREGWERLQQEKAKGK